MGGRPTFDQPLFVASLAVGDRDHFLRRINKILDRKKFTNNGPYVRKFETAIANRIGVRHALAVCNGTIAIGITLKALSVKGEVILPAFNFVAASHLVLWQSLIPVLCDVDLTTHNLTSELVQPLITHQTSCILPVHLWGRPCDVSGLKDLAGKNHLSLLFDASHAFGCSLEGIPIGSFGDAEVFSFHATKIVHSFEGGIITTNDDRLSERIKSLRDFGFVDEELVSSVGINGKMTEVCAAMGLTTLESLEELMATNAKNYDLFALGLDDLQGINLIQYNQNEMNNFQYIILDIDDTRCDLTRDQVMSILRAENVIARRYFYPGLHRLVPYRSLQENETGKFTNTEALSHRLLCLPTGNDVNADDIEKICDIVRAALKHATELKDPLLYEKGP